ncbi:MAG: sigma-54-dependent Fis family transcriptional regulator [Deltaproteobacteria bacterium]|nr:sigma-54-dependent Fis family transcriptional regulator [Deltaproteobacteria bacterium]
MDFDDDARELHDADVEQLERRLLELALRRTSTRHGAIFLWRDDEQALALDFHVVDDLVVTLPDARVRRPSPGQPPGIALLAFERNEPYLCRDTAADPNYARYFLDVGSIAAVPIPWQDRAIGVLTVSADDRGALTPHHLVALVELAQTAARFLRRAQQYRRTRDDRRRPLLIKGLSPQWLEVERRIERASPSDVPVLIHGESGTGKELVAHAIHFNSRRESKPFVTVNCAAIPENLLESVLFGHVRGAFTGASFEKQGEFHKADGGTLFLDELGDLPLSLQSKLLRAVESGEVAKLGSNKPPERVDVRLVGATHRDLRAMVAAGSFRADLYFRLGVMVLELPPLRAYREQIAVLSAVFLQQAADRMGKPAPRIGPEALALLRAYDFPGNVRELRNAIEHAVVMSKGEIQPADLPESLRTDRSRGPASPRNATVATASHRERAPTLRELREAWLAPLETQYLTELLQACEGNVARAAARAGVDNVTLYRLLRKRGLAVRRTVVEVAPEARKAKPRRRAES